MANSILNTQAFVEEVKTQYGYYGPVLPMFVNGNGDVFGDTVKFPLFKAAGDAKTHDSYAGALTKDAGAGSFADAAIKKYYWAKDVDSAEEFLNNFNMISSAAEVGMKKVSKAIDGAITAAMTAGVNAGMKVAVEAGKPITYAQLNSAIQKLAEKDAEGDIVCVLTPKDHNALLGMTEITSGDYVGMDDLPLRRRSGIFSWRGITFIRNTSCPANRVYMWERNAVGFATKGGMEAMIERLPGNDADQVLIKQLGGATVIDDDGLVEITTS